MGPVILPDGSRVYLDANIFVDSAEQAGTFPALTRLLARVTAGHVNAVTSTRTLAEQLVVPLRAADARLQEAYGNRLTSRAGLTVVDVTRDVLVRAARIRAGKPGIRLPDAIHVATAQGAGCDALLTNDGRLRSIPGLTIIPLAELA